MLKLAELGFRPREGPSELFVTIDGQRLTLPPEYVTFLKFQPPARFQLGFRFANQMGEESEGYVCEFMNYSQEKIQARIVHAADYDCRLLPIATDGGGNYLYFALSTPGMPVVDISYASGAMSMVAPTFGAFIDLLYPLPE